MTNDQFDFMMAEMQRQTASLRTIENYLRMMGQAEAEMAAYQAKMLEELLGNARSSSRDAMVEKWGLTDDVQELSKRT